MKGINTLLAPKLTKVLEEMGQNIQSARLRRMLSTEQVAEKAGIARSTLWQVEKGLPNVSLGIYAQVLLTLGLEEDLRLIGQEEEVEGRKLQNAKLPAGKRTLKK